MLHLRSLLSLESWRLVLGGLSTAFFLAAFSGCAIDLKVGSRVSGVSDIQERLSSVISRNGFSHGLRSERDGDHHLDSIHINIPLDSLKRRHYSLENLMKDVGKVCSLPEFSALPIQIELAAGDDEDRVYLQALLLKEVGQSTNVRVTVETDVFNDILITTSHTGRKVR